MKCAICAHMKRSVHVTPPQKEWQAVIIKTTLRKRTFSTVTLRKDRRERRGCGVNLYIKEYTQAYEIKLESENCSVKYQLVIKTNVPRAYTDSDGNLSI